MFNLYCMAMYSVSSCIPPAKTNINISITVRVLSGGGGAHPLTPDQIKCQIIMKKGRRKWQKLIQNLNYKR